MFIILYSNIYLSYNIDIHQVSCSREEPYIYIYIYIYIYSGAQKKYNVLLLVSYRIPNTGHLTVGKLLLVRANVRTIAGY